MQIKDCAKMQEICYHLMPPTQEDISQSILNDCLSLVSNYSGGPEKRKVCGIFINILFFFFFFFFNKFSIIFAKYSCF